MRNPLITPLVTMTLFSAALLTSACGVDVPSSTSELDLTLTARDPNANFSAVRTYTLPDTVQVVEDPDNPTSNSSVNTSLNSFIISQVEAQLNALGYQRLTDPTGPDPDVFVQVSTMATTNTTVYYTGWNAYWGGYYAPWYGAGYLPYSSSYVVNSTIGSLIVNMTDPNNPDPSTGQIPSLWVAVLNGVLDNTNTVEAQSRIQSGLTEAFNQSPYLKGASQ